MPNSSLPRPNLPPSSLSTPVTSVKPPVMGAKPLTVGSPPAKATTSTPVVNPSLNDSKKSSLAMGQSPAAAGNQIQPRANFPAPGQKPGAASLATPSLPASPAGLDLNSPGGAPPQMNSQGQVTGQVAQISATQSVKNYGDANLSVKANSNLAGKPAGQVSANLAPNLPPGSGLNVKPGLPPAGGLVASANQPLNQTKVAAPGLAVSQKGTPGQPVPAANQPKPAPFLQGPGNKAAAAGSPLPAQPKSSLPKWLPLALGGVALVALVVIIGSLIFKSLSGDDSTTGSGSKTAANPSSAPTAASKKVTLTYWGLWEPDTTLKEVLADFEKKNPTIKVDYRKQSHLDYRERLQTAISSGNGPDVFRFHASWTPMLAEELTPIPAKVMSANLFEQTFYPIAVNQLQSQGQLLGIPLMYDGLALYYNRDILKSANAEVPKTWGELKILAEKLTVKTDGQIERGGLAIGNTTNVEHFADIIGLLIYQNGGDPAKPLTSEVRDAIRFYVSFAKTSEVYSTNLPASTTAFAKGDVAMMFAPSWRAHEVMNLNPNLNFGIAQVPQLSDQSISWASYWAEGVSSKSKYQTEAWQLLSYLASEEVMKKLYSEQSQVRAFGEIYSRRDLAESSTTELVTAYLLDAPQAKSWYLCSFTHDNGLNDQIIKYYQDAVNAFLQTGNEEDVLSTLNQGVTQVLKQYSAQ